MKNLIIALFMIFAISACQPAYDWCVVHLDYDSCEILLPADPEINVEDMPLALQAQECGGVGNTFGTYLDKYYAYKGISGDSVFWYRYKKQDNLTGDFNLFKFMAHKFDADTVYTTNIEDDKIPSFQAVIDGVEALEADSLVYIAPQLRTKFDGATNWYPVSDQYPVHVKECEGWASIGDTIFLTY